MWGNGSEKQSEFFLSPKRLWHTVDSNVRNQMVIRAVNQHCDMLLVPNGPDNSTLLDFWQWAFSDLCDDDLKGIFAEWLVHKLLGIVSPRRVSWANSDVVTPTRVTLEVKASSYWQSWKVIDQAGQPYAEPLYKVPVDDSKIRFGGLTARDSTSTADMTTSRSLKSQLYVFAFQHEKDIERWNAMDLSQWEFYIVRAEELVQLGGRSVSLRRLRLKHGPLTSTEFVTRATELIEQFASENDAVKMRRPLARQPIIATGLPFQGKL